MHLSVNQTNELIDNLFEELDMIWENSIKEHELYILNKFKEFTASHNIALETYAHPSELEKYLEDNNLGK